MEDDMTGQALAGWLLARRLLQYLVHNGTVSKEAATKIIDDVLLLLEMHQRAPKQNADAIESARDRLAKLLPVIAGTPVYIPPPSLPDA